MTDHLEEYVRDTAWPIDGGHRPLQRAALREVLKLSAGAVEPAESQIVRHYERRRSQIDEDHRKTTAGIEQHFTDLRQQADDQYRQTRIKIENKYKDDTHRLVTNTQGAKQKILWDTETSREDLRKRYEENTWMPKEIAAATQKKHKDRHAAVLKAAPGKRQQLNDLKEYTDWLLEVYRYKPPQTGPDPASTDGAVQEPVQSFEPLFESADQALDRLRELRSPKLFSGATPFVLVMLLTAAAVAVPGVLWGMGIIDRTLFTWIASAAGGGTLLFSILLGVLLWKNSRRTIADLHQQFVHSLDAAYRVIDRQLEESAEQTKAGIAEANRLRDEEINPLTEHYHNSLADLDRRQQESLEQLENARRVAAQEVESRREKAMHNLETNHQNSLEEIRKRHTQATDEAREKYEHESTLCRQAYEAARDRLTKRWRTGLERIAALQTDIESLHTLPSFDFNYDRLDQWTPPRGHTPVVPFGRWEIDPARLATGVRDLAGDMLPTDKTVEVPALLCFPDQCSLLLQAGQEGRNEAIRLLRSAMLRVLVSQPPGRVRFTIIDPVGLGENFAGFMHLADFEEALVGGRIWTESAHIEQQLTDLTNHMENVIQKYLRNEFETIEAYNKQAGELAEPYRFLVIADFAANFSEEAARRLGSIINSGARCGVYTLIAYDTRHEVPPGIDLNDIAARAAHLLWQDGKFVWQDEIYKQFELIPDPPPSEDDLTRVMHAIGQGAKDSTRVEVPFQTIAPREEEYWSKSAARELLIPIGRTGAVRMQNLHLGRGVAQHALIAGKTGSGKSTLLHVIVTNLALWYSPDEVELYLVDFKKGVEFKTYAVNELPHARAVAIESDREFGLSVLQRLDAEMERRGQLFRQAGVQDLAAWREATGEKMPRTLLIVDEFQVFFSEDDKLAQDAALLLDRLVRQGRAFGVHVMLGSQTLGGSSALPRSSIGQMAVRIALQCSESDSQLILDDDNLAARLLTRPGEAIYNDAGGLVKGNSPFQTAWLADQARDQYIHNIIEKSSDRRREPLIVFEGNAPADIGRNRQLTALLESPSPATTPAPVAWLGEAVAIKEPTAVPFRRQSGAHLLMVGQRDELAVASMISVLVSLAAQHPAGSARFMVLDGTPPDSPLAGRLQQVAGALDHEIRFVGWTEVADTMSELADELHRRQENDTEHYERIFLFVHAMQRYRMLRRKEDDFSFSADDEPPGPEKRLTELLREGPTFGLHIIAWADTYATLTRTLDRPSISEFDNRVLFQMSAADSSNLIDTPDANRLGFYRAIFYSEEQGLIEKFRPYAMIDKDWLAAVKAGQPTRSQLDG